MIGLIRPIGPMLLTTLTLPFRKACRREVFAVPTLVDKVSLQRGDLLVEQVIGLVDQADHRVGDYGRVRVAQPGLVPGSLGFPSPDRPHRPRFAVVLAPL